MHTYKEPFINLAEKLGVKPIVRGFYSIGRGKVNTTKFLNKPDNKPNNESYRYEDIRPSIGVCNCSAMDRELFIGHDGNIYLCGTLIKPEYFLGNILNIEKIIDLDILKREKNQIYY